MKNLIAPLILWLIMSIAIGYFLGRKRQIGFGWSLFFSIFFSAIGGFIITMLSPKYYSKNQTPSKQKITWGWVLLIFFGITFLLHLFTSSLPHFNPGWLLLDVG